MTSLIFWGPYLAHKGVVERRREKQRIKNYERWEGLRDEYDEQRKIARESRSLDIQRPNPNWDSEPGIFTLRDQQEANDARTGWRPQESWEPPRTQLQAQMTGQMQQTQPNWQRHASATPSFGHLPMKSQKTGATWDEGLPAPLQVSRRSFDDYEYRSRSNAGSREQSQTRNEIGGISRQQSVSRTHTPSGLRESVHLEKQTSPPMQVTTVQELPKNEFGFVEPVTASAPGGRMAELIERGY